MSKDIYEYQHANVNKLFIRFTDGDCEISFVNIPYESDEETDPTEIGHSIIHIPFSLLPKLSKGIDEALTELKRRNLDNDE